MTIARPKRVRRSIERQSGGDGRSRFKTCEIKTYMKYRLLNDPHERGLSGAEQRAGYFEWTALAQRRNSINVHVNMTESPTNMKRSSIATRISKGLVTDGPFAETRELLGG